MPTTAAVSPAGVVTSVPLIVTVDSSLPLFSTLATAPSSSPLTSESVPSSPVESVNGFSVSVPSFELTVNLSSPIVNVCSSSLVAGTMSTGISVAIVAPSSPVPSTSLTVTLPSSPTSTVASEPVTVTSPFSVVTGVPSSTDTAPLSSVTALAPPTFVGVTSPVSSSTAAGVTTKPVPSSAAVALISSSPLVIVVPSKLFSPSPSNVTGPSAFVTSTDLISSAASPAVNVPVSLSYVAAVSPASFKKAVSSIPSVISTAPSSPRITAFFQLSLSRS